MGPKNLWIRIFALLLLKLRFAEIFFLLGIFERIQSFIEIHSIEGTWKINCNFIKVMITLCISLTRNEIFDYVCSLTPHFHRTSPRKNKVESTGGEIELTKLPTNIYWVDIFQSGSTKINYSRSRTIKSCMWQISQKLVNLLVLISPWRKYFNYRKMIRFSAQLFGRPE